MSTTIQFGKMVWTEEGLECVFPGIGREDDGTNPEMSGWSGTPQRSMGHVAFPGWLRGYGILETFLLSTGYAAAMGNHTLTLTEERVGAIVRLPHGRNDLNRDRFTWMKYWAQRARQEFGDEAVMYISW